MIRKDKKLTEQEFNKCMRRMKRGDKDALKQIYEAYLPYIYTIVLGVLQNRENAEDVTSDFFLKLWDISDRYEPGGGHRGWIATIARNMAIDALRKTGRELLYGAGEDKSDEGTGTILEAGAAAGGSAIPDGRGGTHTGKSAVEDEVIEDITIKEALSKLSEKERVVVHLKIIGELSFKEIAEVLKEPMGTITWRYQSAVKKLRKYGYE